MSKYENSGNLFNAANTDVVRKGKVDIAGSEAEMMITRTKTKDKKGDPIEIYEGKYVEPERVDDENQASQ